MNPTSNTIEVYKRMAWMAFHLEADDQMQLNKAIREASGTIMCCFINLICETNGSCFIVYNLLTTLKLLKLALSLCITIKVQNIFILRYSTGKLTCIL